MSVVVQGKPGLREQYRVTQGVNQVQNNRARPRVFISVINTESAPSVYAGAVPAGAACGCVRPFVVGAGGEGKRAGSMRPPRPVSTVVPHGSWREGGCRDRRPGTLGRRPGVTGEADHPVVTKQRWAPSSSLFLKEDSHSCGPVSGQEPLRARPPGCTPSLCVSISKLRFSHSVTKPVPPGSMEGGRCMWRRSESRPPLPGAPLPPPSTPSTWTTAAWGPGTAGSPRPGSCLVSATCAICPVCRTP